MKKEDLDVNFSLGNTDFEIDLDADPAGKGKVTLPDDAPYDHMKMTGDIEQDSKAKLNEYQRQQKEHMRSYRKRLDGIYDTGYYFCICFKDSASREAFMREFSPRHIKDRFVDGDKFASDLRAYARKKTQESSDSDLNI